MPDIQKGLAGRAAAIVVMGAVTGLLAGCVFGPPPPGICYVWRPGRWAWNGARHVGRRGHYVARPA